MTYRISEIDIPADSPFKNDELNRKPVVEFLTGLISRLDGPFVLAIDSPWGTGKTTLIGMLAAELHRQNFQYIQVNAWKIDYTTDPLIALVSSIDRVNLGNTQAEVNFQNSIGKIKKIAGVLAKRSLIVGAKVATMGILDAEKEIETAAAEMTGNITSDVFELFNKERKLLEDFREELEKTISLLSSADKKKNLIFFIDELDRCRPTFAIELLERVKHLFDVPNLIFVLSIDKKQLESIITAVYGQGIDAPEYLRRFIDLEMGIPMFESKKFTKSLITRLGLDSTFKERNGSDTSYDKSNFIEYFSTIADSFDLSLRARERCLTRLKIVMDQTPSNYYLHPILVSLLIVLRTKQPEMFKKVVSGSTSPVETMNYVTERMRTHIPTDSRIPLIIEAYLTVSDPNADRRKARMTELNEKAAVEKQNIQDVSRNKDLSETIDALTRSLHFNGINIATVAAKIDLASMLRD